MGARDLPAAADVGALTWPRRSIARCGTPSLARRRRVPGVDLQRAVDALSRRYREGAAAAGAVGRLTDAERLAYAVVRLPATAAALDAVFDAVARHTRVEPQTITDLGAGPGTVLWPALSRWPAIRRVTLLDRDPELLGLGVRLWKAAAPGLGLRPGLDVQLRTGDLAAADAPAADVVVLSYAVGELTERAPGRRSSARWR